MLLALAKPELSGISVSLPVVMDFQGYLSKGMTAHLSLDGFSIITDLATSEGSSISIQFCFARDFPYMSLAGLVESVIEEEGRPARLWRVVAKFIDLAGPERAILASCLQEFESAPAAARRRTIGARSKLKSRPHSIISLFVTDNPYFFHYQKNGPPDQQRALADSPTNGRNQQNRPTDAVPCAPLTSFSHSRVLHGFCKMLYVIRDLLVQILPPTVIRVLAPTVSFAFIAHPRDINDVYRKFPIARFFPRWLVNVWLEYQWPIVGSYITGLKDIGGNTITGAMLFSPLTTEQMLRNPRLARKRVYQTVRLAEKMGARIAGLGAFTSIVTKDGAALQGKVKVGLTTGNAHSAAMAVQNVLNAAALTNLSLPHSTAAIVGAAGSVGSACAKLLSRFVAKLILVDIKKDELKKVMQQLQDQSVQLEGTSSLDAIRQADVIIAATSCPHRLITAEHLKPGAIVIDAAQPHNVSEQVPRRRRDVLVIQSAIVITPGVDCNFDLGLGPGETFGCLSESMILTAIGWQGDYSLGKADPQQAAEMIKIGRELGFRLASFRNSEGYITENDLTRIARARRAEFVKGCPSGEKKSTLSPPCPDHRVIQVP